MAILALIGVAPFSLFMSEFLILKAAIDSDLFLVATLLLLGLAAVFICALGYLLPLCWESSPNRQPDRVRFISAEALLVYVPLMALLVLGLWMPEALQSILWEAAHIINGTTAATAFAWVTP